MDNILLESALGYARRGWWVFPCREYPFPYVDKNGRNKVAKEKSPYSSNGFKDATCDEYLIEQWWDEYPEACIGISAGHSGLFVIDVDVKKGREGINNYMQLGIPDSDALKARTPSMGLHFVFKGNGKSSTNVATGIDTRGKGGYFIAPPSVVIVGDCPGRYVALNDWDQDPGEISEWSMQKLFPPKERKKRKTKDKTFKKSKSHEQNVLDAKAALQKLPMHYCENYSTWIEIGMSLHELDGDGLDLWINWSSMSDKFDYETCLDKWNTFAPNEITLGSLMYYAYEI
jgi:putative DNA primase/helicase